MPEAVVERCSVKKVFLETSQNSQENTCVRVSILIKACNFIKKESLAQVFSCEFCEISKNTFYCRTPLVAAASGMLAILKAFYMTSKYWTTRGFLLSPAGLERETLD